MLKLEKQFLEDSHICVFQIKISHFSVPHLSRVKNGNFISQQRTRNTCALFPENFLTFVMLLTWRGSVIVHSSPSQNVWIQLDSKRLQWYLNRNVYEHMYV
jgi:hypothetical protein